MVKIGHARIDENGKSKGGELGDQTGKEVMISDWYDRPWIGVFRCKTKSKRKLIANAMVKACNNDDIGYDQANRTSLYFKAKEVDFDLAKVGKCETDCSALVAVCVNAAGIEISKDMYTGIESDVLEKSAKFYHFKSDKYCRKSDYLKVGDILLGKGHTAIVVKVD